MAGVTLEGFEAKRLADVLDDAEAQLSTIVDPTTGETLQPDFGSEDPAMQVVKAPLDQVADAWEMGQATASQFDPRKAVGAFLRGLVQINGILAQPATGSVVTLTASGTPGAAIPAGALFSDVDSLHQWAADGAHVVGVGGTVDFQAICVDVGPVAAAPGTITQLVSPIPGVASVTNADAAILGRFAETDTQLRLRRDRSTLAPSSGPVESIYSNLSNIPGVTFARVYVNNTLATDSRGIPGKSVAAVVVGGLDDDIAFTLLERTGVTASWYGDESKTLIDAQGEAYVVKWTRPDDVPIYVDVEVRVTNAATFPVDGIAQIKAAILAYAQGGAPALGIDDGFGDIGFVPGSLVVASRLYTAVNFVPGHEIVALNIGLTPGPTGDASIQVDWDKFPLFTAANIDVSVVA